MRRARDCRTHSATLFDLVDGGGPLAASVEAALRHLDGCPACRREIEGVAPLVARLRRLGASTRRDGPAPDAWPAVRAALAAPSPGPRRSARFGWLTGPLGGIIAAPLVAALLLVAVGSRLGVEDLAASPYLSETVGAPPVSGEVPAGARIPSETEAGSVDYLAFALAWAAGQQTPSSVPSDRQVLRAENVDRSLTTPDSTDVAMVAGGSVTAAAAPQRPPAAIPTR